MVIQWVELWLLPYVSKNKDNVDGLILLGSYIYGDVLDKDALTIYWFFKYKC